MACILWLFWIFQKLRKPIQGTLLWQEVHKIFWKKNKNKEISAKFSDIKFEKIVSFQLLAKSRKSDIKQQNDSVFHNMRFLAFLEENSKKSVKWPLVERKIHSHAQQFIFWIALICYWKYMKCYQYQSSLSRILAVSKSPLFVTHNSCSVRNGAIYHQPWTPSRKSS